jgi:hypothetical protein
LLVSIFNRQINKLQDELVQLEKIFNPVTVMTELYRKEYEKIAQLDASVAPQQSNNRQL